MPSWPARPHDGLTSAVPSKRDPCVSKKVILSGPGSVARKGIVKAGFSPIDVEVAHPMLVRIAFRRDPALAGPEQPGQGRAAQIDHQIPADAAGAIRPIQGVKGRNRVLHSRLQIEPLPVVAFVYEGPKRGRRVLPLLVAQAKAPRRLLARRETLLVHSAQHIGGL